jgi:hypothetical protein
MRKQKLPCLPRATIQLSNVIEKELWHPNWNCYCCQDGGVVAAKLVSIIIPDYDPIHDKLPLCNASGCDKSMWACTLDLVSLTCDWRFEERLCNELDKIERENWRQTRKQKFDVIAATKKLADEMSLRNRERDSEEHYLAEQNHRLVLDETDDSKESNGCTTED